LLVWVVGLRVVLRLPCGLLLRLGKFRRTVMTLRSLRLLLLWDRMLRLPMAVVHRKLLCLRWALRMVRCRVCSLLRLLGGLRVRVVRTAFRT